MNAEPRARLLLVDDDPLIQQVVAAMLGEEFDVTCAGSGAAAMAFIRDASDFVAVLCDAHLLDMDAPQLQAHLDCYAPALADRVLWVTGGAKTDRTSRFLHRMQHRTLLKPFLYDELRDGLARLGLPRNRVPPPVANEREVAAGGATQRMDR